VIERPRVLNILQSNFIGCKRKIYWGRALFNLKSHW